MQDNKSIKSKISLDKALSILCTDEASSYDICTALEVVHDGEVLEEFIVKWMCNYRTFIRNATFNKKAETLTERARYFHNCFKGCITIGDIGCTFRLLGSLKMDKYTNEMINDVNTVLIHYEKVMDEIIKDRPLLTHENIISIRNRATRRAKLGLIENILEYSDISEYSKLIDIDELLNITTGFLNEISGDVKEKIKVTNIKANKETNKK